MTRHLIHIGYPKSGSTFLQRWFERHPQLRYAPGGVAGYHTVYEMCRAPAARYRYHVTSHEGLAIPYDETARHGGPPVKDRQAEVCDLLRALHPGSTILIVTRGFEGMILSSYSQYVRGGGTDDLAGMCRALGERMASGAGHYFDYDHLVRLYRDAFGRENVIVLPYELLHDDAERFLRVLEERLGLEHASFEAERVNPSLSPAQLYWYPRIARAAKRLGPRAERRFERWRGTGRLAPVAGLLARVRPERTVTAADFPAELLALCEGKATLLRDDPLFQPYAAEYLWQSRSA